MQRDVFSRSRVADLTSPLSTVFDLISLVSRLIASTHSLSTIAMATNDTSEHANSASHAATSAHAADVVATSSQPPLYRHAVESIFAFASLADLAALLSVCKDWRAAVASMAPCRFTFILNNASQGKLAACCLSSLARHIGELQQWEEKVVSVQQMALICSTLKNLTCINAALGGSEVPAFNLLPLRDVILDLSPFKEPQALLDALTNLTRLHTLELQFGADQTSALSVAPLIRIDSLTVLELTSLGPRPQHLSLLRSMHHLRHLSCIFAGLPLSELLAPPHQLH